MTDEKRFIDIDMLNHFGENAKKFFGESSYSLPVATIEALGGIKSGGDITVSSAGAVTVNSVNGKTVGVSVPANAKFTDTVYTLPTASTTVLGGVKVDGNTINIDSNGVITATGGAFASAKLLGEIDKFNTGLYNTTLVLNEYITNYDYIGIEVRRVYNSANVYIPLLYFIKVANLKINGTLSHIYLPMKTVEKVKINSYNEVPTEDLFANIKFNSAKSMLFVDNSFSKVSVYGIKNFLGGI